MFAAERRTAGVRQVDVHTERRRLQFATLLEHSPDAIAVLDSQGRICEWNPAAETLLGRARLDVIDVLVGEMVPPDYQAGFDALRARLLAGAPSPARDRRS